MLRRLLGSFILLAFASALCLGALEAAVRILDLHGSNFIQFDPHTGWTHRPGAKGTFVSDIAPGVKADVSYNQLGLRGPETTEEKPAGRKRLLLLGDSFTESEQVPYEQTWGQLVEDRLNGRVAGKEAGASASAGAGSGAGYAWETLNAGVAGYGTDNALLYLRSRGHKLDPDAVLLMFFTGNDVSDNDSGLNRKVGTWQREPFFTLDDGTGELVLHDYPLSPPPNTWSSRIKDGLRTKSRLYLMVRDRLYKAKAARNQNGAGMGSVPSAWGVYRRSNPAEWDRGWKLTRALIAELRDECDAMGVPLLIVSLPTGWRVDLDSQAELLDRYPDMKDKSEWDFDLPDRRLEAIAEAEGIPLLSLTTTLQRAFHSSDQPLYNDHLSKQGHEIVAGPISDFIRQHLDTD